MGYQKRPSPLTAIKEASYQLLLNNTEAGTNVFKNRPVPLWPIQLSPSGAVCLYFSEGKGDDRGQDFPRFYINESFFTAECLVQAAIDDTGNPTCDNDVELLAQEVFDIITSNPFLKNPITGEKTVGKLKYSHYKMDLKAGHADQVLASLCLYFRVWHEVTIGTQTDNDTQPFKTGENSMSQYSDTGHPVKNTFPIQQ